MGDLEKQVLAEMENEFAAAVMKDLAMSMTTSAVGNLSVDEYGNHGVVSNTGLTTLKPAVMPASIDNLMTLADPNLLIAVEKTTIDQSIAIMDEDDFKRISKERLATKLREEVAKKAKYTMIQDPRDGTITTRAKVYAFSEQELRNFVEKLATYR